MASLDWGADSSTRRVWPQSLRRFGIEHWDRVARAMITLDDA
jgi:hypothetical protein